jgi:chromosome segregation ATPase
MEASLLSSVQQVQDLTTRHAAEIAQLVQLRASHADALASKEHHLAQSRKYRDLLSTSDASLSSASLELATLKQRLDALEESSATKARESREKLELAEEEASKKIRDLTRTISSQTETISGLEADKREQRKVFEDAIRDRASAEMSAQMSSTRVEADSGELERLSKEVARLKSQEAQRELRIVHLTRSRAEVRECLEGLEIALDSKQQELELVSNLFSPIFRSCLRCSWEE